MGLGDVPLTWTSTVAGRRRFFILSNDEDYDTRNKINSGIQRAGLNMTIQSQNADVIKIALVKLHEVFNSQEKYKDCRIRLTIHDEIVTSCPKEISKEVAKIQIKCMKEASQMYMKKIPTEVSVSISDKWKK